MYDENNIFAKIIEGKLDCKKIYEDDDILAFEDIDPVAPVHILVIPKNKFTSLVDFTENNDPIKIGEFFKIVKYIAETNGLNESGYRIVTNHGDDSGQTVKHFHVHIIGGRKLGNLVE